MKTVITAIVAAALLAATGCEQRTETQTVTDTTGTSVQKTTTYTATVPSVDTAATAEAKRNVEDAAQNAAHATGTALEKAGKKIEQRTEPTKKH